MSFSVIAHRHAQIKLGFCLMIVRNEVSKLRFEDFKEDMKFEFFVEKSLLRIELVNSIAWVYGDANFAGSDLKRSARVK